MSLVQSIRQGRDNDPAFGTRMRGTGVYADLIAQRFRLATQRLGLNTQRMPMDASGFRPPDSCDTPATQLTGANDRVRTPPEAPAQGSLF